MGGGRGAAVIGAPGGTGSKRGDRACGRLISLARLCGRG